MINIYYDKIVDGVKVPNGIPENFTKYYVPFFNDSFFRKEQKVEPAVYPSDLRQPQTQEFSIDSIKDNETEFLGYYTIEGFGSAKNAMGINIENEGIYESSFNYISKKSLDFLQKGVLKLCICYLQESFITDDIIHSIHYNTTKLNIQNSIVIVNDFLAQERYENWCDTIGDEIRFKTIVFCHSLVEKSYEINGLLNKKEIYHMASDYEKHSSSVISIDEFYETKNTLRKNSILCMNRRMREHRLATLCLLNKHNLVKDNGVSFQFTIDSQFSFVVEGVINDNKRYNDFRLEYDKLRKMKYQYVDYPIALEAKDGVNHGYGWENKRPYLDSYLNITTETDFINPTGYASEKVWKPFGFFQPVLLVGSQGTLEFIRSFGFKTFDGFIDESYDKEKDNVKRFELIEKEIIKLSKMSKQEVHDWYWSMEDILVHNFNLFKDYGSNRYEQYVKMFKELK